RRGGRAHLHRRRDATLLAFGFRCDRGALYDGFAAGAGRDRRDRPRPFELRPDHSVGGLHRPRAWSGDERLNRELRIQMSEDQTPAPDAQAQTADTVNGAADADAYEALRAETAALKEQ